MFQDISINGNKYGVMTVNYKNNKIPVVIDADMEEFVKKVGNKWNCNLHGVISIPYNYEGHVYDVKLHEIIISQMFPDIKPGDKTILHINKMMLDNRKENLIYDIQNKEITKNMKKRRRIITLPVETGISPDELPTYVWYVKPEGTHGERFMVKINNICWKSTSSNKVSLKYKLEETKAYLRKLKEEQPELFKNYSMNGDYNTIGIRLLNEFYQIIYKAGFNNIRKITIPNATDKYLMPKKITSLLENNLFESYVTNRDTPHKKIIKNIPDDLELDKLPEYCYYHPETSERGDYFFIKKHPKCKLWYTSTSKNVNINDKYEQLLNYLEKLKNTTVK